MVSLRKISALLPLLPCVVLAIPGVDKQIALMQKQNSPQLQYPTDFTQNIVPKPIHSHNDCEFSSPWCYTKLIICLDWRDVPLLTALSFGVASVEADVWLVGDTLFVGHELAALSKDRTFDSLYVQPLLTIIKNQNPKTDFTKNQTGIK